MPIKVHCDCGSALKAPDHLLGTTAKCPACGREIVIREAVTGTGDTAVSAAGGANSTQPARPLLSEHDIKAASLQIAADRAKLASIFWTVLAWIYILVGGSFVAGSVLSLLDAVISTMAADVIIDSMVVNTLFGAIGCAVFCLGWIDRTHAKVLASDAMRIRNRDNSMVLKYVAYDTLNTLNVVNMTVSLLAIIPVLIERNLARRIVQARGLFSPNS